MKTWNRSMAAILVLTVTLLFVPETALCAGSRVFAKAGGKQITRHEPKFKSASELDIPVDQRAAGKKSGTVKWVLIGLGAAAVIALAAGGGGGGGGGGSDDDDDGQTGTFNAEW